jgi:type III secretion protein Q
MVVAFTRLAWSRLADLEPGDAVIFPTPAPPANDWPILLSVGGREFPACLRRTDAGREVEIRGVAMESAQPSEGTPPEGGDLLDRLPVTLTAILGRVELTAGAVARLAPGAVISLDRPVGAEVQLRAGRRAIGRGELVEVDGALGVRLTALTL